MTNRTAIRHVIATIVVFATVSTGFAQAAARAAASTEDAAFFKLVIASTELPPLRTDTTNLKFSEFFRTPVGRFGLEPTERLLSLQGKRVRIVGYMVRQEEQAPGYLILAPTLVTKAELADGPADDFPPQVIYVHLPNKERSRVVAWTPHLYVFEGTIELGAREESDGRFSTVRLLADLATISTADSPKMPINAISVSTE